MSNHATEMELGIKVDHYAAKVQNKRIVIGKFVISEVAHNEWEVTTQDGRYLDTFTKREQAVRYAKALKAR